MADRSYIGKGKVYLGPYGGGGALVSVGNCSRLELSIDEEKKELLDFTSAGGGKANVVSRITGVTVGMTLHDISPENLAKALRGTSSAVTAAAVTNEAHTAYKGGLVVFDNLPDPAQPVTVTGAGGTPTYTEGTDYVRTRTGIEVLAGGGIADGSTIEVDYTKAASDVVEALTQAGAEFTLVFDGLNEAQGGKAVSVRLHRVKFSPAQGLGFIADEFAGLELTGEVLKDESITGSGLSQYLQVTLAQ